MVNELTEKTRSKTGSKTVSAVWSSAHWRAIICGLTGVQKLTDRKATPNKYPLPPLLTAATLLTCYLLDRLLPIGWEPEKVTSFMRGAGFVVIGLALLIDIWAFLTFRRNNANMMPHKAASQLLLTGPFAYSRNPIYFANVLLTIGCAYALGSRWFLLGALVLFVLLSELAIKREEKHMEENFGDHWRDYCKAVRRWI